MCDRFHLCWWTHPQRPQPEPELCIKTEEALKPCSRKGSMARLFLSSDVLFCDVADFRIPRGVQKTLQTSSLKRISGNRKSWADGALGSSLLCRESLLLHSTLFSFNIAISQSHKWEHFRGEKKTCGEVLNVLQWGKTNSTADWLIWHYKLECVGVTTRAQRGVAWWEQLSGASLGLLWFKPPLQWPILFCYDFI